ncbi:YciI family protein [Acaryochloris sp. IP29b_bin.137]|uniref:YciI family protein n=1 Tax=Acaryochloris sp. IP29b_bin.137 TaxID=2969217 RepID=UPI002621D641|nr:YciI family protein [Acaryochloris sp. IP29b_bin.137]
MSWYIKIERGIVDKATFDRYVPAHLAYIKTLDAQGHHPKTGYWRESAGGMLIFQAQSYEEAQAIVQQDPLILNRCVEYELHEWVQVGGQPL